MKIWLVGGAVRDRLMGLEPKDHDYVVVGSSVEEMLSLGYKQVGAAFPVFLSENGDEHALARSEKKIAAGHQGFSFDTAGVTLESDLVRRDFSIGSMAMDLETSEIIDPFGGQEDIKNKLLRHVSPSFADDPLRVFRAAKFSSRYNFTIHHETQQLMKEIVEAGELEYLAKERIMQEMLAIICNKYATRGFVDLYNCGALSAFSENVSISFVGTLTFQIDELLDTDVEDVQDKLGWLVGVCAANSDVIPSDKEFIVEMNKMKMTLQSQKMAIALKNYGSGLFDFMKCSKEDALSALKSLEFLSDSKFNKEFIHLWKSWHCICGGVPGWFDFVIARYKKYAEQINVIDCEAISHRFGKTEGKAIGAAIKEAYLDVISNVDYDENDKHKNERVK